MTWLTVQLIALVIGANSFNWTANGPSFEGADSLRVMLVTQIVGATLLGTVLCRSSVSTITAAIAVWPFICSAGFLSAEPIRAYALAGTYVTMWLLALGVGNGPIRSPLLPTYHAFLAIWVLLDPAIAYLQSEFATQKPLIFGPISGILALLDGSSDWRIAMVPTILLASSLLLRVLPSRR